MIYNFTASDVTMMKNNSELVIYPKSDIAINYGIVVDSVCSDICGIPVYRNGAVCIETFSTKFYDDDVIIVNMMLAETIAKNAKENFGANVIIVSPGNEPNECVRENGVIKYSTCFRRYN